MHQPQRAQRLDQRQLAPVEFTEFVVAIDQRAELLQLLGALAREQHPQILHRRAAARIVQIDKMRPGQRQAFGRPENVAGVAVAVQAQLAHVAHAVKHALGDGHRLVKRLEPARLHVQRQITAIQQNLARVVAKSLQIQRGPVDKSPGRSDGVNARQKAANPFEHVEVFQLGPPSAPARRDAETEAVQMVQCAAVQRQRADHRDFSVHQLGGEGVFFEDLRVAPAVRAVELDHHRLARQIAAADRAFEVRLIDAVFIARQRHHPAIAAQADAGQRVQHHVGREVFVSVQGVTRRRGFIVLGHVGMLTKKFTVPAPRPNFYAS